MEGSLSFPVLVGFFTREDDYLVLQGHLELCKVLHRHRGRGNYQLSQNHIARQTLFINTQTLELVD